MSNKAARSRAGVVRGTLDLMVLQTLDSHGPRHGNRGTTETSRKARFYAVTPAGRRQLAGERHAWNRMAAIIYTLPHGEA